MRAELACGEARNMASEILDGALSSDDEAAVMAHVARCQTCPALYRAMVSLHARLVHFGTEDAVPPDLAASIRGVVQGQRP